MGGAAAFGVAAGLPLRAWAQPGPVRQSLSAFSRDPGRVASLRRGVAVMKSRQPSDPRSWFYQAAVHAYNDALYQDALAQDPALAQVDAGRFWNKCPHFGGSSAEFLVWHRAYLFHFERILRDAAGDDTLALPYWDYSDPDSRSFPAIFARAQTETGDDNPLFHPNREQAFVSGISDLSALVGEAADTMSAPIFFSSGGETGFGGEVSDAQRPPLGRIEQRPHNDIHLAVGGAIGSANGAMADVPTAAFDPIFWVHHANIDRLWTVWAALPGKSWGALPLAGWFDARSWEFHDADGAIRTPSRRDMFDRRALGIAYDTDSANQRELALPPPPPAAVMTESSPEGGVMMAPPPPPPPPPPPLEEQELLVDQAPLQASPDSALSRTLAALQPPPVAAEAPQQTQPFDLLMGSAEAAPPPRKSRVLLELNDIRFTVAPSSGFAVYLAGPDDAAAGRQGDFVGLIDLFGASHRDMTGMAGMGTAQRFDVTAIVSRRGQALTLVIAPYALLAPKGDNAPLVRADGITIGSMRFVQVG
jgi:hypothetical protein